MNTWLRCHVAGGRRVACRCSGHPDVLGLRNAKECHEAGVGTCGVVFSFHFDELCKTHNCRGTGPSNSVSLFLYFSVITILTPTEPFGGPPQGPLTRCRVNGDERNGRRTRRVLSEQTEEVPRYVWAEEYQVESEKASWRREWHLQGSLKMIWASRRVK